METQKKIDWSRFINKDRTMKPVQHEDGHIGLLNDQDQPLMCIYSNPQPLPHPTFQGQIIIHQKPCNTRCPAFNVSDRNTGMEKRPTIDIFLTCCGATIETEYKPEQMKIEFETEETGPKDNWDFDEIPFCKSEPGDTLSIS